MSKGDTYYRQRGHDIAYWAVMAIAAAAFMAMNWLTTLKEDDMAYALIEEAWTPVRSLLDVLRSHAVHYVNANGRLADLVAVLFSGLLGKAVFNVCNTVVFVLMAHLVSLLSAGRRSLLALSLFLAVVGTCFPVPGETMLWLAGSCNYMWAITASLALVWYLQRRQGRPIGWGEGALALAGAFIAGGINEATSFGFLAGMCLYYLFNRCQLERRAVVVMAGYALGVLLIVASPGAWHRAAQGGIVIDLGLADLLSSRWYIFQEKAWRFYLPLAALIAGLAMLFTGRRRALRQSLWTYVFICMALVMFALGITHERAYAPWVTVSIIVVTAIADVLTRRWQALRSAMVVVLLALAAFTYVRGIGVLREYKAYDDQTVSEIVSAPHQAVLRQRQFDGYSRFVKPMNYNSTNYFAHEVIYRAYYGKDNVQFVNDSVFDRYHSGRLLDGAVTRNIQSNRPDIATQVLLLPGQDHFALVFNVDSMPPTFQTARYAITGQAMTADERQRRARYGLVTDYTPQGYYPIDYQGKHLLILPLPDSSVTDIAIPLDRDPSAGECCFPWPPSDLSQISSK